METVIKSLLDLSILFFSGHFQINMTCKYMYFTEYNIKNIFICNLNIVLYVLEYLKLFVFCENLFVISNKSATAY